jgi:dTDP-D-glucose 4,6-dehydratase
VSDLERDINFKPSTSIEDGLKKFVDWYKEYYKVENWLLIRSKGGTLWWKLQ